MKKDIVDLLIFTEVYYFWKEDCSRQPVLGSSKSQIRTDVRSTHSRCYASTQANQPHFRIMFASRTAISRVITTSTRSMSTKVAVLGAAGGIGQPLSLLLKLSPYVDELSCYDIVGSPGVAADISHVRRVMFCILINISTLFLIPCLLCFVCRFPLRPSRRELFPQLQVGRLEEMKDWRPPWRVPKWLSFPPAFPVNQGWRAMTFSMQVAL